MRGLPDRIGFTSASSIGRHPASQWASTLAAGKRSISQDEKKGNVGRRGTHGESVRITITLRLGIIKSWDDTVSTQLL